MPDQSVRKVLYLLAVAVFGAWVALVAATFAREAAASGTVFSSDAVRFVSCTPYSSVIDAVKASVVTVTASDGGSPGAAPKMAMGRMNFDAPWDAQGNRRFGCGVIIDGSGYVLTNLHIVENAGQVEVRVFGAEEKAYAANIVATEPAADLAFLKINPEYPLPTVQLGNSDLIEAGDVVMAIGSPFGLEYSVTMGIISDDHRAITVNGKRFPDMIQTDAAINRGNSGGPLIDSNGVVVGINTAILSPTGVYAGLSFAVPINDAKKLLMVAKYSAM